MSDTAGARTRRSSAGSAERSPLPRTNRPRPISPGRTAVIGISAIALAELVAMAALEVLELPPFWPATLVDMTIMVVIIVPPLYLLVYRPVTLLLDQHRRAEEALERRTRDLEALYGVTSTAAGELDVDRLLSRVLDVLIPALEADAGWMQVIGGGPAGPSRFVAARGVQESLVGSEAPELRPSCATCLGWQAAPPASAEAPAIAECEIQFSQPIREAGFMQHRSLLLPVGEKAGAIVNLLWRRPRPCGEAEATLLAAIGRHLGIAVENAALFQAEQRAREQSETLRSASFAITRSLDIEAVFTAFLEHLGRLVPYDRAKVMLLEGGSRLKVRAVFTPSGKLDFPDRPYESFEVQQNAAVQEVLATRRSLRIDDTLARLEWGGRMRADVERSWLGVPLVAAGEAIGLYTLVKAEPGYFTPERVYLVEALYAPASVALANARLFEEVLSGREELKKVSRKLVEAQEGERLRVARELHDEAGQLLASLILGLRRLEYEASRPDAVLAHTQELKQIADTAQESLHHLASDLRPAALDHLGLAPALAQLSARLSRLGGPVIQLETLGFDGRLSPAIDIALYRIAQEALTNAVRHSGARRVSLVVERREKSILMVIEDDGRGFDVEAVSRSGRLGIPGIRERAEMLGGTLLVESGPGSGTTLVVEVPHVT